MPKVEEIIWGGNLVWEKSQCFFCVTMANRSIPLIYIANFSLFWDNIFQNFPQSSKKYLAFVLVEELRNDQGDHQKRWSLGSFFIASHILPSLLSFLVIDILLWEIFSFYLSNNHPRPRYFFTFTFITFIAKKILTGGGHLNFL